MVWLPGRGVAEADAFGARMRTGAVDHQARHAEPGGAGEADEADDGGLLAGVGLERDRRAGRTLRRREDRVAGAVAAIGPDRRARVRAAAHQHPLAGPRQLERALDRAPRPVDRARVGVRAAERHVAAGAGRERQRRRQHARAVGGGGGGRRCRRRPGAARRRRRLLRPWPPGRGGAHRQTGGAPAAAGHADEARRSLGERDPHAPAHPRAEARGGPVAAAVDRRLDAEDARPAVAPRDRDGADLPLGAEIDLPRRRRHRARGRGGCRDERGDEHGDERREWANGGRHTDSRSAPPTFGRSLPEPGWTEIRHSALGDRRPIGDLSSKRRIH